MKEIKLNNLGTLTPLTPEEVYSITAMQPGDDDWCCHIKQPHYYRVGDLILCLSDSFLNELERCDWGLVTPLENDSLPLALVPDVSYAFSKVIMRQICISIGVYSVTLNEFLNVESNISEDVKRGWFALSVYEDEDEEESETEEG